jgi:hypothetical protein
MAIVAGTRVDGIGTSPSIAAKDAETPRGKS